MCLVARQIFCSETEFDFCWSDLQDAMLRTMQDEIKRLKDLLQQHNVDPALIQGVFVVACLFPR